MLSLASNAFDGSRPLPGWSGSAGPGPNISKEDYVVSGDLRVGKAAPEALTSSLLYRLSYHGFSGLVTEYGRPAGYDRVRKVIILDIMPNIYISLTTSSRAINIVAFAMEVQTA